MNFKKCSRNSNKKNIPKIRFQNVFLFPYPFYLRIFLSFHVKIGYKLKFDWCRK